MRCRDGLTFIEMLVATVLGIIVVAGAWMVYGASFRQTAKTDVRLKGIKESLTFIQRFENDFRRLYVGPQHEVTLGTVDQPGIRFHIYDLAESNLAKGEIRTVRVAYLFDKVKHAIFRKQGSAKQTRLDGNYEALVFTLAPQHPYHLMPPFTPTLPGPPTVGGLLSYLVTCAPVATLKLPPDQRQAGDRTTFTGSLPLAPMNAVRQYPEWLPNATAAARE